MGNPNSPCDTLARPSLSKVGFSYSCGARTLIGCVKLSISKRSGKGDIAEGRQSKEGRGELHFRLIEDGRGMLWKRLREEDSRLSIYTYSAQRRPLL